MQTDVAELLSSLAKRRDETLPGSVRAAFESDPDRFARFHVKVDDLLFDYSKQNISVDIIEGLVAVAKTAVVEARRDAMMSGAVVNPTENSAALHTALRDLSGNPIFVGGLDVSHDIKNERAKMLAFAEEVRTGALRGADDKSFSDVVNLGTGGSDLGPQMATRALSMPTFSPACGFTMFPTSTGPTSPTQSRRSIRVARCSSSLPRHSPPWRR